MTALNFTITWPLNIPADTFSDKGVTVLLIRGGSYGGHWVFRAVPILLNGDVSEHVCGSIETDRADRDPDRALTAVRAWLEEYCARTPFALAHFESLNHHYGPAEAPFSSAVRAALAIPMG